MVQKKRLRKASDAGAPVSDFIALLWTLRQLKLISLEDLKRLENARDLINLMEEKKYLTQEDLDRNKQKVVETITAIDEVRTAKMTGKRLYNTLEKRLGFHYTRDRIRDMAEMLGKLNAAG